jgi:hypothetical protein
MVCQQVDQHIFEVFHFEQSTYDLEFREGGGSLSRARPAHLFSGSVLPQRYFAHSSIAGIIC